MFKYEPVCSIQYIYKHTDIALIIQMINILLYALSKILDLKNDTLSMVISIHFETSLERRSFIMAVILVLSRLLRGETREGFSRRDIRGEKKRKRTPVNKKRDPGQKT